MYILPPIGGDGKPFIAGVRDVDNKHVFDTLAWTKEEAILKAQVLIRFLEIGYAAVHLCEQQCQPGQHVPNCPVGDTQVEA